RLRWPDHAENFHLRIRGAGKTQSRFQGPLRFLRAIVPNENSVKLAVSPVFCHCFLHVNITAELQRKSSRELVAGGVSDSRGKIPLVRSHQPSRSTREDSG